MQTRKAAADFMEISGNIYLCQVSDTVSCGACCGLYNVADASRRRLCRLLEIRTQAFARVPRDMEAILDFGAAESEKPEIQNRPMPEFHHCPYLGFIGQNRGRVGCLLHPLEEGNNGVDFRGLSHYGSMTCGMYFCPTHYRIAPDFKTVLQTAADDWYLYGLILQEVDLLEAFYSAITGRCQKKRMDPASAFAPAVQPLWKQLFELKRSWPFASGSRLPANYFFNDNLYTKPPVDYSKTGQTGAGYDAIFRQLYSVFDSRTDLIRAGQMLDELFEKIANTLDSITNSGKGGTNG